MPNYAIQGRFAEAYNRKDVDAMATAFSADEIRVTPSGIFHGRDEIRQSFQDALILGLREYSVKQTGSRKYGELVFNVSEWRAKLGEQPFHDYSTSILGSEDNEVRIFEETVTVSVTRNRLLLMARSRRNESPVGTICDASRKRLFRPSSAG